MLQFITQQVANQLYNLANLLLIVSLVLGVISTCIVVWMGSIKEEYASKEIAAMQERTANAEHRTVEAQIELEKLKKATEPRTLTQEQQNHIQRGISKLKPLKVTFGVSPSSNENQWLVRHIAAPFSMAGWNVHMFGEDALSNKIVPDGILILSTHSSIGAAELVTSLFNEIGLYTTTVPMLDLGISGSKDVDAYRLLIIVGDKPVYKISSYTDTGTDLIKNRQ